MQANVEALGIGAGFGLKLQSVIREPRFRQTIVRVQLTLGRGTNVIPLENHGILTFRANGKLADYHGPLPSAAAPVGQAPMQDQALTLIERARQLGLDRHGVPLSIVRKTDGSMTVEARVVRGRGINTHAQVYSLEKPHGERRAIITPIAPRSKAIVVPQLDQQ